MSQQPIDSARNRPGLRKGGVPWANLLFLACLAVLLVLVVASIYADRKARDRNEDLEAYPLFGFINLKGQVVINTQYDSAHDFSEGLAVIEIDARRGYIDRSGKMAIDAVYVDAGPFSEGLAAVQIDGKYGYIDKTGRLAIVPRFDRVSSFCQGRAAVCLDGRYGYIYHDGAMLIEPRF